MLHHDSLANYYQVMFTMKQHHHWDIGELESMLPWERQIYTLLLQKEIEKENERIQQRNAQIQKGRH